MDGLAVEVVDRARDLSDLLVGRDVDRLDRLRFLAGTDPGDGVGQAVTGHGESALTDLADRLEEAAGDGEGQRDGGGQRGERQEGAEERAVAGIGGGLGERVGDAADEHLGDLVVGLVGVAAAEVGGGVVTDLAGVGGVRRTQLGGERLGAVDRTGETVDGRGLDTDLGEELLRAGLGELGVGHQALLHRQRQPAAHRLRELLEPRVRGRRCGVHAGDELGDARLELTYQGDPGGRTEVLGLVATHGLAEVEQGVDVGGLQLVELGVVAGLGEGLGRGDDVVDRVDEVALGGGTVGLGGHHRGLGRSEVVDGRLDDRDLLGTATRTRRVGHVALHAQDTEGRGQKQRDGEGQRDLAAQGPSSNRQARGPVSPGCILSHVCLAIRERLRRRIGAPSSEARLNLRSPATFRGLFAEVGHTGCMGTINFFRSACRMSLPHLGQLPRPTRPSLLWPQGLPGHGSAQLRTCIRSPCGP